MRLGLLLCDHVRDDLRPEHGDYREMFARLFSLHPDVELVPYDLPAGEFPGSPDECDGWITTGSRHSAYDDLAWIRRLEAMVAEVADDGPPFVGVCFGHQVIGRAMGGEVRRSPRGWGVGVSAVEVARPAPWMDPTVPSFRVLSMHGDQVEVPPPTAEVHAGNPHCPVGVMTVGENLLGIQGHPEFTTDYDAALMRLRRGALIPEAVVDAGLATLASPPDTGLIAGWIVEFLRRR